MTLPIELRTIIYKIALITQDKIVTLAAPPDHKSISVSTHLNSTNTSCSRKTHPQRQHPPRLPSNLHRSIPIRLQKPYLQILQTMHRMPNPPFPKRLFISQNTESAHPLPHWEIGNPNFCGLLDWKTSKVV